MTFLARATSLAVVAVAVLLLVPGLAPIRLSYVTSDSMAPAIQEGEGYLIHATDDVDVGDVATFSSPERGGYVTHRIVDETPAGYVTKGDNNPSTDQAGGMPPVPRDAVEGAVVTVGGEPLTLPGVGPAASWLDRHRLGVLAAVGLALLGLVVAGFAGGDAVTRDVVYASDVVLPLLLGVVLVSAALMLVGTTDRDLQYVAVEDGSPAPHTVAVGDATTQRVDVEILASPVTTAVVDLAGVELVNASTEGEERVLWVTVPAQAEPGVHTAAVSVHPYPAVLPRSWLEALHDVHAGLAMLVSLATVYGPFALLYGLLLDGRTRLRAPRWRRLRRAVEGDR